MAPRRTKKKIVVSKAEPAKEEEPVVEETEETVEEVTEEVTEDATEAATEETTAEEETKEEEPPAEFVTVKRDFNHLISQCCNLACVPFTKFFVGGAEQGVKKRGKKAHVVGPKAPHKVRMELGGKALEVDFPKEIEKLWDCKQILRDIFLSNIFDDHELSEAAQPYAETEMTDVADYSEALGEFRTKRAETLVGLNKLIEDNIEDADEKAYKIELLRQRFVCEDDTDIEWPSYDNLEFEATEPNKKYRGSTFDRFNLALKVFKLNNTAFKFERDAGIMKCSVSLTRHSKGADSKSTEEELFTISCEGDAEDVDYVQLLADLQSGETKLQPRDYIRDMNLIGRGAKYLLSLLDAGRKSQKVLKEQACGEVLAQLIKEDIMKEDCDLLKMSRSYDKKKVSEKKKVNDKRKAAADKKKAGDKRGAKPTSNGGAKRTKTGGGSWGNSTGAGRNNFGRGAPAKPLYRANTYLNQQPMMMQPVMQGQPMMMQQQQMQHQQAMMALQQRQQQEMAAMNQMYAQQMSAMYQQPPPQGRKW